LSKILYASATSAPLERQFEALANLIVYGLQVLNRFAIVCEDDTKALTLSGDSVECALAQSFF
jgi:hypothetical protein